MSRFAHFLALPAILGSFVNAIPGTSQSIGPLADGILPVPISKRGYENPDWCGIETEGEAHWVSAEWVVPKASVPRGGSASENRWAYQWVGIDGTTCDSILHGGIGQFVNGTYASYFAWGAFYPDGPQIFSDFEVSPGDKIFVEVQTITATEGQIVYDNLTKKKAVVKKFSAPQGHSLCYKSASWINEDPGNPSGSFPQLTPFTFEQAKASKVYGPAVSPKDGQELILKKNGKVLCHSRVARDDLIQIIPN